MDTNKLIEEIKASNLSTSAKDIILNLLPFAENNPAIQQRINDIKQLEADVAQYQMDLADEVVRDSLTQMGKNLGKVQ